MRNPDEYVLEIEELINSMKEAMSDAKSVSEKWAVVDNFIVDIKKIQPEIKTGLQEDNQVEGKEKR